MQPINFLYNNNHIGVKPLDKAELSGAYPFWFRDMEVCMYNRYGAYSLNYEQVERFVESLTSDRSQIVWAIYCLEENLHIGNLSLQSINFIDRTAEIAFLLGEKRFWGKGLAAAAADWLISHGFEKLNLNRIACGTAGTNIGMQKLAEKLGMQKEGCRRQALYLNGEYVDIFEYGLLKAEWLIQKSS